MDLAKSAVRVEAHPEDSEITLLIPAADESDPELSIVIPAMNESLTIAQFVAWCHEGIGSADVRAEILIVDSSSDDTAEQALAAGARRSEERRVGEECRFGGWPCD